MYTLKGFINIGTFADNTVGNVIHPVGEISKRSLTYSREVGQYSKIEHPGLTLISMLSSTDEDGKVQVPNEMQDQTLRIAQWLYDRTIVGSQSTDRDQILADILVAFQQEASNFDCGNIVDDGRYTFPEWITWVNTAYNDGENRARVWFADASFQTQYDEYEIVVVPPIIPVDDFFKNPTIVKDLLSRRTFPEMVDLIQDARNDIQETVLRGEAFNYVNPNNSSDETPSDWSILIYGAAGNNIDSIKDALTEYVLENSTRTRDQWIKILPDLFKRTEVIVVPIWSEYAIPDRTLEKGIYSPIMNLNAVAEVVKAAAVGYSDYHVSENVTVLGHPFKSLAIGSIGGPENRDDKYSLRDFFPDFISVPTHSVDFNRMSEKTQEWAYLLSEMLIIAEDMTRFSDVPLGMTRLFREGVMYLVKNFDNVQYLVVVKWNFTDGLLGEDVALA